jgi:A/G-specific adenine glycosylase
MFDNLITWSLKEYSNLPWRKKRTVFRTLVSEIMLQQTTVSTVLNKFEDFITQFSSVDSIASASEEELTIAWKGLGYYRRCRNLKAACQYFSENYNSKIPNTFDSLIAAPGIGEYTANAILSIGKNKRALAVDANLERVISRLYKVEVLKGPKLIKEIYKKFNSNLIFKKYSGSYRELNEALMDLGRVFCISRNPRCELCPLRKQCLALINKKQTLLPLKLDNTKKELIELYLVRIIVLKKDKVLVYKKSSKEWLSGQMELPTFVLQCSEKDFSQYPKWKSKQSLKKAPFFKTVITKYKINNYILEMNKSEFDKISIDKKYFFNLKDLEKQNFSTASIKAIKKREGL